MSSQSRLAFGGRPTGFDAVLGAKGSALQLVLNTVFHLETSPGNISWHLYERMESDPRIEAAIPYAVGDNYHGFRVVGTTQEVFTAFREGGISLSVMDGGRFFEGERREAVIGSTVARKTGLRVGDAFLPSHGFSEHGEHHREEVLVVGILESTSSPADQVLWMPIEGVFRMEGHVLRGAGETFEPHAGVEIPDEHKEVSAVMLRFRSPQAGFKIREELAREGADATLAWPISQIMIELFEKLGWVHRILTLVAYLIVIMASGSILACLYNTMNERRHEFAVLRALGARRRSLFSAIVMESSLIAILGVVLAFPLYVGLLFLATSLIRSQTGVVLPVFSFHPALVLAPLGMVILGAVAGIVPAFKAYATSVVDHLTG